MQALRRSCADPRILARYNQISISAIRLRNPSHRTYSRPSFAPKPTIDIKHIRQNPGLYEQNCIDRNYAAHSKSSWRIVELHEQWLALQQNARGFRERNNRLRAQLAQAAARVKEAGAKDVPVKQDIIAQASTLR